MKKAQTEQVDDERLVMEALAAMPPLETQEMEVRVAEKLANAPPISPWPVAAKWTTGLATAGIIAAAGWYVIQPPTAVTPIAGNDKSKVTEGDAIAKTPPNVTEKENSQTEPAPSPAETQSQVADKTGLDSTTAPKSKSTNVNAQFSSRSESGASEAPHLLYQAAVKLRKEGDAAGALQLLAKHARIAPQLSGTEEVMAIRMEALARLGSSDARKIASRYLKLYPSGRYRTTAERLVSDRR